MDFLQPLIELLKSNFPDAYPFLRQKIYIARAGAPVFLAMGGAILLLQKWRPAIPGQPLFSKGLFNDFMWFWATWWVIVYATAPVSQYLRGDLFQTYLSTLTIDAFLNTTTAVQFVIAVLAQDFIRWFHHWARHKVPLLWQFHAVHHSQTEMNFMTDYRVHPFDRLASILVGFIPFGILMPIGIAVPTAVAWHFVMGWYSRVYHANLGLNYGPLRYILVTPQSHRVHHSVLLEHRDTNFGVLFCIWDRMFGTQKDVGYDEYPPTGVPDPDFPMETSVKPHQVIWQFLMQWVYPLKTSWDLFFGRAPKDTATAASTATPAAKS